MFLPILMLAAFLAIALIVGIAFLTRERGDHEIRRDVRKAVVNSHHTVTPTRGIRS